MNDEKKKEIQETYNWIKVPRYTDNKALSWEERFTALENHHVEETNFLISKIRDIVQKHC